HRAARARAAFRLRRRGGSARSERSDPDRGRAGTSPTSRARRSSALQRRLRVRRLESARGVPSSPIAGRDAALIAVVGLSGERGARVLRRHAADAGIAILLFDEGERDEGGGVGGIAL